MKFGWEEVHEIAEELEHIKTDKFFDRMDELMGFPTTDPHGSPIPDKNGNFNKPNYKRLSQISSQSTVIVKALRDSSTDFLLFLNNKSIQLTTKITVTHIEPFDGSFTDTMCMIIVPLYMTANLVHCNVWTYMAFGSMYANWLTLIHSEYAFPWDGIFHLVGFGTPADHHVHHAFFKYNYGHLFMWPDMVAGTYKHPREYAPKAFNKHV